MALRPDRKYTVGTDISYFMNAVAERGGVVTYLSGGSGAAMDDANATVAPSGATQSGQIPAGLLLNDMVNLDLTRQHINWHKDEVQLGGKVTVLTHGEVTTNVITTGVGASLPTIGAAAFFTNETFNSRTNTYVLTPLGVINGAAAGLGTTRVGTFKSIKDADGYAKVEINMGGSRT